MSKQEKAKESLFDSAMANYPKRDGGNPKVQARQQWDRRIAEGVTEKAMLAGMQRYAAWCEATGKINTEFVLMARTFFGRERHFELPWDLPAIPTAKKTRLARAVDAMKGTKNESD